MKEFFEKNNQLGHSQENINNQANKEIERATDADELAEILVGNENNSEFDIRKAFSRALLRLLELQPGLSKEQLRGLLESALEKARVETRKR